MNIKSWEEHKAEMNKQDFKETMNIFYTCLCCFIVIVGYQSFIF